jgi:hypothetical protein
MCAITFAVNGRGELAFAADLAGPGLNSTNSAFLIAGTPANLHYLARSSQPALDIPGSFFMNMRDQIAFRANLSGPAIGNINDVGIWVAEPSGAVNLVARAGDIFDAGDGVQRRWSSVYFGSDPESLVGPQGGRRCPFNDRGELLFIGSTVGSPYCGLFLARTGIVLTGERTGNDVHIRFPTLAGGHYRVDYRTNFSIGSWSVLVPSVGGSGTEVTVTDTNTASFPARFYRVLRLE